METFATAAKSTKAPTTKPVTALKCSSDQVAVTDDSNTVLFCMGVGDYYASIQPDGSKADPTKIWPSEWELKFDKAKKIFIPNGLMLYYAGRLYDKEKKRKAGSYGCGWKDFPKNLSLSSFTVRSTAKYNNCPPS